MRACVCRNRLVAVEHAKTRVVAALLVMFEPDHFAALARERFAEHMMRGGLDAERVLAGLQVLPLIEAGQLILARDDLEARASTDR